MFAEITDYRMAVYSRNPPSDHLAAIALKSGADGFVGIIYFWDRNRGTLPDAVITDALSTSVFVLGVEQGLTLIGTLPDYESIVIDAAGRMFYSDGLTPTGAQNVE